MENSQSRISCTLGPRRSSMLVKFSTFFIFFLSLQISTSLFRFLSHFVDLDLFPDEGIYNTYVLDSDYKSWTLLMHCAEKEKSPRYLSSFIMSRTSDLGNNVNSYLREKLPKYLILCF